MTSRETSKTPTSKLQRSPKIQKPKSKQIPTTNIQGPKLGNEAFWSLGFGTFLEVECWCLELPLGPVQNAPYPLLIIQIPAHSFTEALFELVRWNPTEFAFDLGRVNRVAAVVTRAVFDESYQLS